MSHKYVSNKAVLKDKGFLSKLGSTLMGRSNPDPFVDVKVQSSITWRKTSDVKARIKTATGTIPVYDDLGEEEMAVLQAEALAAAGGSAPSFSGPAAVAVQTAALAAGFGQEETTQEATTVATYLVKEDYSPEDSEGLAVVSGQKLILVDKSSPNKRPRLEGDEAGTQLLDNSAARHKMAIRPKRNHPDPRSRAHDSAEERWLMRDQESGKEGLVPSRILDLHSEFTTSMIASLKRSVQQIAMEETAEVKKNLMKEIREYKSRKSSSKLLGPSPEDEARAKRAATIRELIETEEEFVRDLEFVMENYYSLMDKNTTPRNVRDHKELIFNNFKFIADFHKNVLIEGVKYNVEVPKMIGKTFLRLERDFDKHAEYCSNEPLAQEFIENNIPVKEFFEEYSQKLGDDKRLQEHLKLPIQRLNDYQLLIRELVKYSTRLGDDPTDLQRAFELMQTIPQRATDAKFISSIEGFKGNLFKLGRLLRHDWFSVKEAGQKARDRYLFLFKARILITKVKRISEDRSIFILKDIIRLPETSLGSLDNPRAIEFFHIESLTHPNYPIFIEARTPEIREAWLSGIGEYVVDTASVEDLLFDDELRVVSQDVDEDDAGVVSPVPEVQEFEDLPEDGEAAEALQGQEDFWAREPSPPAKRQKPEAVPEETAEVDFWAQKESTPPRRQPVPGLAPAAEAAPEQVEESTPVAEQEKASAEQASFIPQEPSPSAQQTPKEKPEPSKPAEAKPESPKPAKVKPEPPKPAEVKRELPKPAEVKPEPPKPAEVKPEPPKPAEVKPEPPKPAEVKPEPPKPAEVKPEPPKPAEVKPEPPKPAEVKPEPPKPAEVKPEPPEPAEVSKQEPPKPQVQTRAPLAKLAAPAPHKMQEPTTPFTPGGTPKPVFTKTLKGDVVEPGDGVTFVCEVAHPAPYFITWLKDSKPLDDKLADRVQQTDTGAKHALKMTDEGCKHTLQVLNCRVEDSGIYTAKATDENGVWSTCSAQLLVQELTEEERARRIAEKSPFFMVRMKPTQVIENTNLSYTIHVKGDPMPNVTFFKDDKELKEDARVTIHRDAAIGHYELLITHVQREDEGTYKCVATNKFGKAECEASMAVTDEEMLYESLSGKGSLLAKGEKAEFKWFRDGVEFDPHERFNVMFKDDEDTLALVFQNVTPEDAGLYTCVASTSCGKISCSAELTVEGSINRLQRDPEPPNFKEELTDTQVNVGGSAMLECRIGGYPKPELAWTRNGLDVKAGGRIKFLWEDEESVALIIKNCEEKDAGLYRVIAKNELGEVSCSAKLGIKAGPKIVSMKKEVACVVGQKLDYRVEVEGEPTPEIRWLKDGKQLMESDHIKFTKESDTVFVFKIDSMQMDDCCTYTVVASNPMGQVSEFFTIATDAAPQITRGLDPEIEKRYTYDIALEVRGTGSPKPMARWYKNGKEIMADDRFKMVVDESFYILKIRRLERKDKGTYCCELSNSSGTAKSEGVLSVRAPPDFVTPLKDACAKEGGKDVKMFVEWEANPMPTVKWFFNDKPIRDDTPGYTIRGQDTSMVLTIHEATEDVVGTYSVTATNEYGESVCKARFRLHEAPVVTEGLKDAEFLEDNSAKFTFKATGVPTPEIKWTKDGKKWSPDMHRVKLKQEGDDTFTLYFDEAKTEDSGHYVATISNVEGTVSTEASIVVNTPPHIKGSNFRDGKTFIAMHKFVLEVEATAVPEAEATWYFNDKILSVEEDSVKFSFEGNKYTMERIGSDPEHSGQYKCVLKNKIKEVEEVGQVTVIEKEARVRRPLEDIYVKENTDATLKCQIVGDPIPSVEWLRNGKPLPPSERYEVSEERMKGWHTLVLKEVTEQDKSTFTVKGKNKHGECETSARLGVLVRPQPGELNDATVDYGKDLLLNVAIHAFPPPKMVWTLDGRELQEGDHYEYTRDEEKEVYGLLVHSAVLEDAGKITFTASNAAGSESGSCTVKVHTEKPAIVADLEDLSYCLEDDAVFTLRASGLPLPDVEWKLHDKVVKADERHVFTNPEPGVYCMTIKDVCMNDYGPVAVVAKSLVGECASAAKFSQKKIPCEVVEGLENVTKGAEGDDVTLTVKIRASPRPNFVWTKDSDICEASEKIVIEMKKTSYCEATISLTLVEASSIDSGQYRLKFQNELNEESTETALIVRPERRKPKITKPPKELQVLERKRGIFQAKVTGFPKPEVKWMKDGRQIYPTDIIDTGVTGDGFQYLEFKTVTMEDVGQYTIFASNEEGTAEAHAALIVVPPPSKPEFLQSLKASKVILGYPARMEVKLGGYPMPEVQWLKDGQPLNIDGTHYKQIVEPDGTVILQIDAATEGDMGEITCVAKNPEGDSQSSATLSVLGFKREDGQPDGPAAFTEGLKDMCFDEGMVMRLPVAMKGGPVPNMKWYKDGQEIKLDDRCFFTYDGDRTYLEIRPCKGSDSGMYKCVIQNSHGSAETECEVSIRKCYEAPFFTNTFTRMDKLPGSEVKMSVRYDGVPKPELSWFHNGEPILHDGDKYRIRKDGDGQTLTVKELTYSDSGAWKVVAKNREGETEHEAELNVSDDVDPNRRIEAPVFMKVIGDQELFEGYNALFKAVVSGKPEPEFKWLKNGGTIVASNRVIMERDPEGLIRLTIKRITPEDAGQYTLKVWNDYGEASCHGKLICETLTSRKKRPVGDEYKGFDRIRRSGVPMPLPEKPMISALADRRLTLSWMPHLAAPQTMPCTYQVEMCDAPDGDWFTVRTGIRGCSVDITNLMPKGDYKFRVRVANKYGVSEPSPYVATQRFKLELPAIRYEPQMDPNYEYKGDGPYVPEGFRISRDSLGNYFAAPRFLRLPHDTQYGLKGFNANIKWYAYGYPTPKVRFLKNGQPLEVGDKTRFKYSQEVTGEICLYIDRMTEADVGTYECLVRNEHGESRQRIKMDICEYPRVLEPLEEIHLKANSSGKIACRITGFPPCQVQWFRDWEPIAFTYKLRPAQSDPDLYFLHISGCQIKDSGLYSVAASNVAGTVHSSCMVHVEADDIGFFWMGPGSGRSVTMNNRRGTLEDHYDVGDELGRGTQGVVYHCVEHHTGRNFAAKSMWGKDQFKTWMQNEFEMMNALNSCKQIVRLYDAYEGPKNMVLVTELCGGGDLLGTLTQHQYLTEYEVCHYVRQILCALEYMHDRCIAHLGLNVGDILLTRPNGIEIKIGDLSLARNIRISKVAPLDYGMPEFVAPEVANGEGVTYAADMWSLGIITYLLLSGTSPFRGENDRETLTRVKKGEMSFDMEAFRHISDEAKDFIAKLLLFKPDVRMNVKDALLHPWIKKCLDPPGDAYKINTDRLKSYYAKFRDWYSNASCKRWFRRRTLASCFTHPSKMVYPPGEVYTPPESPERDIVPAEPEDYHVPHRKYSYELGLIKNESHYQMGPDTYLLQLRDVDFPCRLRSYMKVATDRSPAFAMSMRENDYDYTRIPIVHERRRFTDVMDEEIDDERKRTALDRYTAGFVRSRMETCSLDMPRRVKQEVPSRLSIYDEVVVMKEGAHYGTAPFLREKPGTCAITDGCPLTLTCVFTGDPEPVVQWFKNDIILGENSRVSIHTANGRSTLAYQECHDYDVGLYKVVARNTLGQATHRFRLVQGHIPGPCDSPDVSEKSDTEVLLHWSPPADDGGSQILCYHVQMKLPGDTEWLTVSDNIDHEFFLVKGLTENSIYQFRVAAKNFVGWGDFSVGTAAIRTTAGAPKVRTTREMQILQQATESGKIVLPFLEKKELDYRKETDPVKLKSGENAQLQVRKYDMIAELSRGRFSVTARCIRSDDRRHFAAKLLENYDREDVVREEFEVFKTLRHERIAQLYEAYNVGDVTVFIMEQLAGLDVLTYLASKREYSEQHVVTIAMQVLDALSYLHWRGMCHLDVQPDNVVLTTPRRCDVKLVDFGSTQRVSKQGSTVPVSGLLDFVAPEVLAEQKAFPSSDIWSLGSLIYLLLSGKSAFGGVDDEDTHQNILHVRYRYEHLGSNTTQEAIRFLMLIFKRDPSKRPTVDDCREHKWLVENDYIVKKRERATFLGSQLRDFDQAYHKERAIAATKSLHLLTYGGKEIPAAITYEPETQ